MTLKTEGRPSNCAKIASAVVAHKQRTYLRKNLECASIPFAGDAPKNRPGPPGTALGTDRQKLRSPYILEVEVNCEECGGSGFDPGGIDPWGPEVCPKCRGAKTQRIKRNYLAEAFQIAANPDSTRQIERLHLVAVIQHCREVVSALVSLPEVA